MYLAFRKTISGLGVHTVHVQSPGINTQGGKKSYFSKISNTRLMCNKNVEIP
jgi:hypothetical protein